MRAPLLPKLRGYFAEFLNESYLNALVYSTYLPVSVYGTIAFLLARSFSSQCRVCIIYLSFELVYLSYFRAYKSTDLPIDFSYVLRAAIHSPHTHILLRHSFTQTLKAVQEYLTCFPSPTPIGLGLGID